MASYFDEWLCAIVVHISLRPFFKMSMYPSCG